MIRIALIAIVVVAVISIGVTIWITGTRSVPSSASRDFFAVPQDYPTEGGQVMAPRFDGDAEDGNDAPTN